MDMTQAKIQISNVLSFLVENEETIAGATSSLGIPLEDVLCNAVREAFRRRMVDSNQLPLFKERISS
jgi:hypothetical protein